MTPPKPTPRRSFVAILLVVALTSCSFSDDDDPPPTTKPQSPEEEVKAAYLAYWEMLERLSASPDPEDEEISDRVSGPAREEVLAGLRHLVDEGRIARVGPAYEHTVLSLDVDGDEALVKDCAVDDSVILDRETGDVVGGGEAATGLLEVTLGRRSNGWRVEQVKTIETWQGAVACDEG